MRHTEREKQNVREIERYRDTDRDRDCASAFLIIIEWLREQPKIGKLFFHTASSLSVTCPTLRFWTYYLKCTHIVTTPCT